jgi:hypothetical protein
MSQVFRDAIEHGDSIQEPSACDIYDPLGSIIGIGKDCDPRASEDIDEVVYGPDIY